MGDGAGGEGASDNKPIVLEGYRSEDFESLLKVLLPKCALTPSIVSLIGFSLDKISPTDCWKCFLRLLERTNGSTF